jgi:hypothetical protein
MRRKYLKARRHRISTVVATHPLIGGTAPVMDPIIAPSFLALLPAFAECFTAPSFETFRHVIGGWLLCIGRRHVSSIIAAADAVGYKHHTSFQRFFRTASWEPDCVGLVVLRLVLTLADPAMPLLAALDDTLARHTGKHIASAGNHRDPLLSTAAKVAFHFGHVWVVLAVVITVPRWNKSFALPVLVRLYRTQKVCKKAGRAHRKKTELAVELLSVLRVAVPGRDLVVVADNGYANREVLTTLPARTCFIGRGIMDAAIYELPPARVPGKRGRKPVKGARLPSPKERAADPRAKWQTITPTIYGKAASVRVLVFDALWHKAGKGVFLRFVVVRGWPGHDKDDVLLCTDTTKSAAAIIETYCLRWPLEETFHWAKAKLGLENPQNRTEHAVLRTAPMAFWCYSLVLCWYLTVGERTRGAVLAVLPWYASKKTPAFSDMLAALRRESWRRRVLDRAHSERAIRKSIAPLLRAVGYG